MRKVVTFIVVIVLVLINLNLIKGSYDSAEKLKQINLQESKVKGLQDKNISLKNQLSETNSTFYLEKQARDKLGFSKNGETTVVIEDQSLEKNSEIKKEEKAKSNVEKWIELVRN